MRLPTCSVLTLLFALTGMAGAKDLDRADALRAAFANPTAAQIIASLTANASKEPLYDMHGNANKDLQRLMVLRFAATGEIMRAIDRMEANLQLTSVRSALLDVLGFVKDPASIEWLRGKRRTNSEAFFRDYLPAWTGNIDGFGSWKWLTGRESWIAFWLEAFNDENSPDRRVELLCVLCQFDDASVVSFFAARRVAAKDPKEILLIESYLDAHGTPVNGDRIVWALQALSRSTQNNDFVISIASGLRQEAFVPRLIGISDRAAPNTYPPYYAAERDLHAITFQCDLHGKASWQDWYAKHGKEGRSGWTRTAVNALRVELAQHPKEAAQRFEKLTYCWNEIAMLPFITDELAQHAEFHSSIAGWINT
jgi:hypothetical protein